MSKYAVDIQRELTAISTTPYGKTMRPNIHDALDKLAKQQQALSNTFDNLVIDAGNSNAEVVDARNDTVSNVNYDTLGERLNSMQQSMNQHHAIPHVTYREVIVTQTIGVLSSDKDEAILTNDDKAILPTGVVTRSNVDSKNKATVASGVKIPDLPTVTPNSDDLVVVESQSGTASTKVSDLLKPVNNEINLIKDSSMKYTQI